MVIATANDPGKLDPALLHRPSRFDRVWTFPLPDEAHRLALLQKRGDAFFSEVALKEAAKRSGGFSMAYVQEIILNALLDAAHCGEAATDRHLFRSLEALKAQRRSVSKEQESVAELGNIGFSRSGIGDF
jgi:SpoVK/Ycf46/Vps4 family AAA+-type ATPase